jgi:hypothetical protein
MVPYESRAPIPATLPAHSTVLLDFAADTVTFRCPLSTDLLVALTRMLGTGELGVAPSGARPRIRRGPLALLPPAPHAPMLQETPPDASRPGRARRAVGEDIPPIARPDR